MMETKPAERTTSVALVIRVPQQLRKRLITYASEREWTISQVVRKALDNYLSKNGTGKAP
jgi:predicted HicB family RNase H-like nuclease